MEYLLDCVMEYVPELAGVMHAKTRMVNIILKIAIDFVDFVDFIMMVILVLS